MEIKTCEQYVVSSLMEALDKVEELTAEVADLKGQLVQKENGPTVVDTTGVYYRLDIMNTYKYNETLKSNNKTPEWLRTVLTDDAALDEWLNMKTGSGWCTYDVSEMRSALYNYLFTALGESMVVCVDFDRDSKFEGHFIDNKVYWLSKDAALEYLKAEVRERVEAYFASDYVKKFEEEE